MVDILTKRSTNEAMMKQEEMEEEFEDGELVEEGEICDEDDEPGQKQGNWLLLLGPFKWYHPDYNIDRLQYPSTPRPSLAPTSSSASSSRTSWTRARSERSSRYLSIYPFSLDL